MITEAIVRAGGGRVQLATAVESTRVPLSRR